MVNDLEKIFPGLRGAAYRITSPRDKRYNCIAWAAGDTRTCWWPSDDDRDTWPAGVSKEETVASFQEAFATLGYTVCARRKSSLTSRRSRCLLMKMIIRRHPARQLPDGRWTSKLGELEDIEHELHDLTGTEYGTVALLMKRPLRIPA